ncbi:MAG: plasmid pRiA4b ORF-3 family protein, partial [Anaerolineales bacterium]
MMTPGDKQTTRTKIFQLRISLDGVQPSIWRRIQVPAEVSLFQLHFIFQIALGWTNSHLHEFIISGHYYGTPLENGWETREIRDEKEYWLEQVVPDKGFQFGYLYDFGDGWEHTILVEDILERTEGQHYPTCLGGARACPPEDVGGIWGYEDFLEAIAAPDHPEHQSYLTWIGDDFDAEAFDRDQVDEELKYIERSEMVRIYQRYHTPEVGPELRLYRGVSEWLEALTAEQYTQFDELPLRRDTVSLLTYLREHRITGT